MSPGRGGGVQPGGGAVGPPKGGGGGAAPGGGGGGGVPNVGGGGGWVPNVGGGGGVVSPLGDAHGLESLTCVPLNFTSDQAFFQCRAGEPHGNMLSHSTTVIDNLSRRVARK